MLKREREKRERQRERQNPQADSTLSAEPIKAYYLNHPHRQSDLDFWLHSLLKSNSMNHDAVLLYTCSSSFLLLL